MSDLIERLRKIGSGDPYGYNTMTVAADRIEALEAEIERLEATVDRLVAELKDGVPNHPLT